MHRWNPFNPSSDLIKKRIILIMISFVPLLFSPFLSFFSPLFFHSFLPFSSFFSPLLPFPFVPSSLFRSRLPFRRPDSHFKDQTLISKTRLYSKVNLRIFFFCCFFFLLFIERY